jgi:hypothetical protein
MRVCVPRLSTALAVLALLALPSRARAQDLEPRAYSPSPVGTSFVTAVYSHQTGNVLVDPTLPIDDVDVGLNATSLLLGRTFGLAGRQASVTLVAPYVWGDVSGSVFEERLEVTRSGAADLRFRIAASLVGGPALTPEEFATRTPARTIGASLTVVAPTGQYDPARLVNIGSHRWSFKPEVGVSQPVGRWTLEATGGVWLFTENDAYFGGTKLRQRPVGTLQGHVGYTVRPGLWLAGSVTYYAGGRRIVDDLEAATITKGTRAGVAASLPIAKGQSVKLAWGRGITTRLGANLNSLVVAWQYAWF